MPAVRRTRYAGRPVYRYTDPLTGGRVHLLHRFSYTGPLPMDGAFPHRIQAGEQFDGLAHKYYGNARWWWIIALYNQRKQFLFALNPPEGEDVIIPNLNVFMARLWPKLLAGKER